jgi:hypothetical protein
MKKMFLSLSLAVLVLGLSFPAQASPPTIDDPSNGETHLFQIFANPLFNGGIYANSQAIANTVPILQTLPYGSYSINAYASFAGFAQDPGFYSEGYPASLGYFKYASSDFPVPGSTNSIVSINAIGFYSGGSFGFFDDNTASGGDIKYTELALNSGNLAQSNGLIFNIAPGHVIVAFEDGAGAGSLGDMDYNDLVLNVTYTPSAPIPGSLLLLGSGILGMMGIGIRRKSS